MPVQPWCTQPGSWTRLMQNDWHRSFCRQKQACTCSPALNDWPDPIQQQGPGGNHPAQTNRTLRRAVWQMWITPVCGTWRSSGFVTFTEANLLLLDKGQSPDAFAQMSIRDAANSGIRPSFDKTPRLWLRPEPRMTPQSSIPQKRSTGPRQPLPDF